MSRSVFFQSNHVCRTYYNPDTLFYCRCGRCGAYYSDLELYAIHDLEHEITDLRTQVAKKEREKLELEAVQFRRQRGRATHTLRRSKGLLERLTWSDKLKDYRLFAWVWLLQGLKLCAGLASVKPERGNFLHSKMTMFSKSVWRDRRSLICVNLSLQKGGLIFCSPSSGCIWSATVAWTPSR